VAKQLRNGLCTVHRLSFIMHRPLFSGPGGSLSKLEALDEHTDKTALMYHLDTCKRSGYDNLDNLYSHNNV